MNTINYRKENEPDIRQVYKKHTFYQIIIASISAARQVRLTRLFAQITGSLVLYLH